MERNLLKIRRKISVVTSDLPIDQQMPLNLFHFWETGTIIFSSAWLRGKLLYGQKTFEGWGGTKNVKKNLESPRSKENHNVKQLRHHLQSVSVLVLVKCILHWFNQISTDSDNDDDGDDGCDGSDGSKMMIISTSDDL